MTKTKGTKWTRFLRKEGRTAAYGTGLCVPKKNTEAHRELKAKYEKFKTAKKKTRRGKRGGGKKKM